MPQPAAGRLAARPAALQAAQAAAQPGAGAAYAITPERRALLNTIRYAEGTWIGGSAEGYRTLYGGGRFASLERHPEIVVHRRYTSAAAGAYQFLPGTWREVARRLHLRDFGPASQDQAALHLVARRGALALFDRRGVDATVLARLSKEWASLPASHGGSAYGQPVKRVDDLMRFYRSDLQRQLAAHRV
ncbi:MAG: muramidase [Synechococcus sp.]